MNRLRELHGDLFASDAHALVIPVNTVGVPGKGLALEFANKWPKAALEYQAACHDGRLTVGSVLVLPRSPGPGVVVCAPTKTHWRLPSRIGLVEQTCEALRETCKARHFPSIAVPALGCGLGGLSWREVRPIIVSALDLPGLRVDLYAPVPRGTGPGR